mmetsp:Transcript_105773/g.337864  ORF Transcript_105773/g.337864 Transcript_105773/m.337864 type:complete len:269 (-) Transcript_105773:3215-4021(-)
MEGDLFENLLHERHEQLRIHLLRVKRDHFDVLRQLLAEFRGGESERGLRDDGLDVQTRHAQQRLDDGLFLEDPVGAHEHHMLDATGHLRTLLEDEGNSLVQREQRHQHFRHNACGACRLHVRLVGKDDGVIVACGDGDHLVRVHGGRVRTKVPPGQPVGQFLHQNIRDHTWYAEQRVCSKPPDGILNHLRADAILRQHEHTVHLPVRFNGSCIWRNEVRQHDLHNGHIVQETSRDFTNAPRSEEYFPGAKNDEIIDLAADVAEQVVQV